MAGQCCITFKGKRLAFSNVCLFDSPPSDIVTTSRHHGVFDICRKRVFPPPHDCKPLIPGGSVISEIPFAVEPATVLSTFGSHVDIYYLSAEQAWALMWPDGPHFLPDPPPGPFAVAYAFYVPFSPGLGWQAWAAFSQKAMFMPVELLDPAWLPDDSVSFFIALEAPIVSGAPAWARFDFPPFSIPYNSGHFEMPVEKASFYAGLGRYSFSGSPYGFAYSEFPMLPEIQGPHIRGWSVTDTVAVNFRLIVRRGADEFKVCWPEDVFKKSKVLAVLDPVSGLVCGPAIPIA